jgi:hypothetical protein
MKNASMIWGGFSFILTDKNYLLHPISCGFESGQPIKEFEKRFLFFDSENLSHLN